MLMTNQIAVFFKMYLRKEVNNKVNFWHADKRQSFLQVETIILGVRSEAYPKYPKEEFFISLQYLQKIVRDKLIFYLEINTKVFYKLIVSPWQCVARHAQSTQNNNFAISLQYLKGNMKDAVEFLSADNIKDFFGLVLSF